MAGQRDLRITPHLGRAAFAACAALVAAIALAACGGDTAKVATSAGVKGASEITAEPVSSAGANPFTGPAGHDVQGVKPPPAAVSTNGPSTYRGGLPGLYGGTRDYATCDAGKLINFLEHNPSKATAWAGTLNIRVTSIRTYIHHLTPVLLRTDTRVTNHGYVNGQANPLQSVLQAGTAVFVNRYGEPVVKCYCGNPLTPPILYREPVYIGPRWGGFSSTHITIIKQSITVINIFTLYDPDTGITFKRPAGTSGGNDSSTSQNLPPQMNPSTTPSTPPPTQQAPQPTPQQQQQENPRADFSPNPGQQGDTFTLAAFGFRPGSHVDVTLVRPDGHVEHYPISIGGDGGGSYTFTNTANVVTGTYNATVTNPATGATAHASVQVQPRGGP
jgi:hypothetical protein